MHRSNWDDYQFILAVADRGTSMAAAERLGVNHTTVLRRIAAFEATHQIKLFTRTPGRYVPTVEGEAVVAFAREISEKLTDVRRNVLGEAVRLEGPVSVTTTDTILHGVLAPHLAAFCALNPLIHLDLSVTSTRLNLTQRDADVAIRPSPRPPEDLIAQRVSGLGFAIYASSSSPEAVRDALLDAQVWVGPGDALRGAPARDWMQKTVPEARIAASLDSFVGIRDCIEAGVGIGILPCCLGDRRERLVRIAGPMRDLDVSVWVLTHRDMQGAARVAEFVNYISHALESDAATLEGVPL